MVVAVVALVSSLTGGAVAATLIKSDDIAKNAVTKKHVKKNAIRSAEVKNGSLKKKDFRGGLPAGPVGPQGLPGAQGEKGDKGDPCLPTDPACVGPKGDKGDKGDPGTALFASVDTNGANQPTLTSANGATDATRVNAGNYRVDFGELDLSACSYQVSSGEFNENQNAQVELDVTDSTRLAVTVHDADAGTNVDGDFHVAVHCPAPAG
jgi:hypothetical protein